MTKYLEDSFTVAVGSPAYRAGWDAVFGEKEKCGNCGGSGETAKMLAFGIFKHDGDYRVEMEPCTECEGTGKKKSA